MSTNIQFSYPLQNTVVGWFNRQQANPLTFISPITAVDAHVGHYKYFPQGYVFRRLNTGRALHTAANNVDVYATDKPFSLEDHSLRIGVDDQEIMRQHGVNLADYADMAEREQVRREHADIISMGKSNTLLGTWRTSFIADGFDYYRSLVAAETGVGNWGDPAVDSLGQLRTQLMSFANTNGVFPNRWLFGMEGWDTLANNPAVLNAIEHNGAKRLTVKLLLELLDLADLDVEGTQVMRSIIPIGSSNPAPDVEFQGRNLVGSELWMTYADEGNTVFDISGLKTLTSGGQDMVETVESYYERDVKTTWYEVGMFRDFQVTAPTCVRRINITNA